jgi:hypothetical protein
MGHRRRKEQRLEEIRDELDEIRQLLGGEPPPPPSPWEDLFEVVWLLSGLALGIWVLLDARAG